MGRRPPQERAATVAALAIAEPEIYTSRKRLELLNFHITRYDGLRASTANRASILLSANTLILAALGILFTNGIPDALKSSKILGVTALIMTLGVASLVLRSVYLALNAIVSTKSSRSLHGAIPDRSLYNHADIVRRVTSAQEFIEEALTLTEDQLLGGAAAELWTGIRQHYLRYQYLRRAVRLFLFSALSYPLVALLVLFPW